MRVIHVELKEANMFVEFLHRHHRPVTGHRFSIGVEHKGKWCGVAIIGRPVARMVDQKNVLEVTRLCTDETKNACSFLYAAAARVGKELGYHRIQTYVLESEPAITLRAAGWTFSHNTSSKSWSQGQRKNKRRTDQPECAKQCWYKDLQ